MFYRSLFLLSLALLVRADKECEKNADCDMEGSICTNNQCTCPPSQIADSLHTKCLPVSDGYGSHCEDNVQCSEGLKSGGMCIDGTCRCSHGYHYFLGQCWKSAGLGEACKRNETCFVSYDFEAAFCSEKGVCVCSPGYYQREYSSCRRESHKPGDPCGIALDCKFDNAVCTMNRTCATGNGSELYSIALRGFNHLKYDNKLFSAALSSKVLDPCKNNEDCLQNAECNKGGQCACLKGYYTIDNSTCHPELGAKCTHDADCIGKNTQCRDAKYCVCKQGFVTSYDGRYCDKMSRNIQWSCLRDEQCGFFGPNSICDKKKCNCSSGTHFIKTYLYCWVQKLIGEACKQTEDCGDGTSVLCQRGACLCPSGRHPSSNNTECRKDSNSVGEPCAENLDCIFQNSVCSTETNKCGCLDGYTARDGKCIAGVGGNCKSSEDCKANGSTCVAGKCACPEGFIGSRDFSNCLQIVQHLNESCSEDSQCSKIEGLCVNGSCVCMKGSHYVQKFQCFISKKINDPCSSYGNCSTIPHSYCRNGICTCKTGYHSRFNRTMCSGASNVFDHISDLLLFTLLVVLTTATRASTGCFY